MPQIDIVTNAVAQRPASGDDEALSSLDGDVATDNFSAGTRLFQRRSPLIHLFTMSRPAGAACQEPPQRSSEPLATV